LSGVYFERQEEFGMAAAALTPRVRVMVVCDAVRASSLEDGVFDLRGVRDYLRAASFPFRPRRLWLYLVLSSPRTRRYPGSVVIIDDETGKTIFHSKINPTFLEAIRFLPLPMRLNCTFPRPGRYTIEVRFLQDEGPDVVKAEQPFYVFEES
jgi:hypothetical protein